MSDPRANHPPSPADIARALEDTTTVLTAPDKVAAPGDRGGGVRWAMGGAEGGDDGGGGAEGGGSGRPSGLGSAGNRGRSGSAVPDSFMIAR